MSVPQFHPERPCNTPAEYIGRAGLLQHAFGRLGAEDTQSFVIIGAEKIGKTSFLHHLCQPEIFREYLDTPEEYLFLYLDAKSETLSGEHARELNFFQELYAEVTKLTSLDGLISISDLRYITDWLEKNNKRLILLIDNFNLIVSHPHYRVPFYESLRSWFSTHRRVGCVVSSPIQLLQLSMAQELSGSPFFNIFGAYLLEPFSLTEAESLLKLHLPPHLRDQNEEIAQIIEQVGLTPYSLHQAGKVWTELSKHRHLPNINAVIEKIYQTCLPHYEGIYTNLKRHHLSIIDALLDPKQPNPELDRIDRTLIERGLLTEDGKKVQSALLARFLRQKLGIREQYSWRKKIGLFFKNIKSIFNRFPKT